MIVLDTHAWIWWVSDPKKLSQVARKRIEDDKDSVQIHVSTISAWEAAMLVARDRLRLTMDVWEWVQRAERIPFLKFVPVSNAIAVRSVFLPGKFHKDPVDRIIIATALTLGATVVTKDKKIHDYSHIAAVW